MADINSVNSYSSLINFLTNKEKSTSKTDLSMESFFKLLAAELQNQDMSSPMSNSEMMTQMTQIAMMQSMQNFSTAMDDFSQINTINYGTSMMGKEVMLAYSDKNGTLQKLSGTVTRVDIYSGTPTLYIDDQETGYPISSVMSVYEEGHKPPENLGENQETENTDKSEKTGETE